MKLSQVSSAINNEINRALAIEPMQGEQLSLGEAIVAEYVSRSYVDMKILDTSPEALEANPMRFTDHKLELRPGSKVSWLACDAEKLKVEVTTLQGIAKIRFSTADHLSWLPPVGWNIEGTILRHATGAIAMCCEGGVWAIFRPNGDLLFWKGNLSKFRTH